MPDHINKTDLIQRWWEQSHQLIEFPITAQSLWMSFAAWCTKHYGATVSDKFNFIGFMMILPKLDRALTIKRVWRVIDKKKRSHRVVEYHKQRVAA